MRTHPKAKVSEVEAELGESLKYAPKRKGGPKYKVNKILCLLKSLLFSVTVASLLLPKRP